MSKLLEVKNLSIHYDVEGGTVRALNNVSLSIEEGMTIGLVGETGAGKTTLAKGIMRLTPMPPGKIVSGEIIYDNKDLLKLSDAEIRIIRGKHISMIFQDPMTSLNPLIVVGEQIAEAIRNHEKVSGKEAERKAIQMLELVGINADRANDYPHQFSGGMKQRVIIAIALALNPHILLADEPTTALDVTIQAQVLEMMQDLKKKLNTAILLITHDLGVVAQTCQKVAVIYAGEIVEFGTVLDVFKNIKHPYTLGLFDSIPKIQTNERRLRPIEGLMPDPTQLPPGCSFSVRCKYAKDICKEKSPEMVHVGGEHYSRCLLVNEINFKEGGL